MKDKKSQEEKSKPRCGIIMPISAIDDYPEAHWTDIRSILYDAIEEAGFEPNLVSEAADIGIIQKRIIQNIYDNPVVVCDVSAKNPNVMFELGLRLAFDKPTIIIKDNITAYSFDTSPIEHLVYPRDLRFNQIVEFKAQLIDKINGTYTRSLNDPDYTTFLKHFGQFTVAKIETKEVSSSEFILEELQNLRKVISEISVKPPTNSQQTNLKSSKRVLCLQRSTIANNESILKLLKPYGEFDLVKRGPIHYHFESLDWENINWDEVLNVAKTVVPSARLLNTAR